MPTYVCLCKVTREGKMDVKKAPERIANARKAIEATGGKMTAFYPVFGRYDYVAIVEGPDDETAMKASLMIGMAGTVNVETLKVLPLEKFQEIAKNYLD